MALHTIRIVAAIALASAVAVPTALADQVTGTLSVQVTVQEVCSVGGSSLNFGTYIPGQAEALLGQGAITYAGCAPGTLSIALDGGGSGDIDNRTLVNGTGSSLDYQLFRDPARSTVWGEGAQAQQVQLILGGSGSVPVYGTIAGNQSAESGAHNDSINITVTF